ncbi:MAG: hypothetical protein VX228_01695, partial [Pseudomonadota bacterium]|nr:hypothetical protein [Pseudomonadota bacterium]
GALLGAHLEARQDIVTFALPALDAPRAAEAVNPLCPRPKLLQMPKPPWRVWKSCITLPPRT